MRTLYSWLLALGLWLTGVSGLTAQQVIDLSGSWDFAVGDSTHYDDYVILPGSMLTNGKGNPVSVHTQWTGSLYDSSYFYNPAMEKYRHEGNMKFPFFLTPERHYVGDAWYRRSIYIPQAWKNQRVTLFLERPHIETTLFVNGHEVGHQMSLSTPHVYDVTKYVNVGGNNEIAIKIYNGIENVCVGQDSHSVTDQTQGNWNGIAGRLELQARPKKINIRSVRIYPDVRHRKAHVVVDLENHANALLGSVHVMQIKEYGLVSEVYREGRPDMHPVLTTPFIELDGREQIEYDIYMNAQMDTWSEFTPVVYRLVVYAGDDVYETTFGLRDITIQGPQFYVNGVPTFIRGTVENCLFPDTGYPPTDIDEWLRILRKCKEYGLNMVRFHSYCPPEAAFQAADQLGVYLQPEGPSWPNHGVKLRRGMYIDQYLLDESKRIIDTYGNHPSFVMMAAGNEPAGDWVTYTNDWVRQMHAYDSTKVYCGASVGGGWAWDGGSEYHVKGGARGLDWDRRAPQSADDYYQQIRFPRNYKDTVPNSSPIVAHEQGQWCAYPDFKEIRQYRGAYKAKNFEIFRDLLADGGMATMAEKFLHASGKLQTLCYKYEIERNLRTRDYSGQGTALEGVLNAFWREKGYCTAAEWREFCNSVVLLARFPKFVYTNRDTLRIPIEGYNALWGTITNVPVNYIITDDTLRLYASRQLPPADFPVGKCHPLGVVEFPLNAFERPTKLTLTVQMAKDLKNHWDFWVYPESPLADSEGGEGQPLVTSTFDDEALRTLRSGGTVLLTAAGGVTLGSDVKQTYLPVFWNTSWFKMRPPHTTGCYIDKTHPLFSYDFPTDDWSNLNWWELLNKAQVMNLMELPRDYQSPIQPIDTWHVSRKLGMLIEANVAGGRLLMTTMDITSHLDQRPVARQMRQAILRYMQSPDFRPAITLSEETIRHFFTLQAPPVNMFTNDSPDELKPKIVH